MRKIKFDEVFQQEFCEFAKTHTVPEISNHYTLKQEVVRRLLYTYNVRPAISPKNGYPNVAYVYDDLPKEVIQQVCNMFQNTDIKMQDLCKAVHLRNYVVQNILEHNFSEQERYDRKIGHYSLSKIGDKNPYYHKYQEEHSKYKGETVADGLGYLMSLKPDWYTGRKNSKYVFQHNLVICEHLGLTEIPKGFCVHHIDCNKTNNDISNLALMSLSAHSKLHQILRKLQGAETIHNGVGEEPETPNND